MTNICYLKQVVLLILSVWYFLWKPHLQRRALILGTSLLLLLPTFMSVCQLCLRRWLSFTFRSGDFVWGDKPNVLIQVRVNSYFLPLTEEAEREGSGLTAPMLHLQDVPYLLSEPELMQHSCHHEKLFLSSPGNKWLIREEPEGMCDCWTGKLNGCL